MGLIERIKSVLGFGASASPSGPTTGRERPSPDDTGTSDQKPASEGESDERREPEQTTADSSDGVDVTVEHEPDEQETERESDETAEATASDDTAAPATESEAAVKGAETDAGVDAELEDIRGIGPTYADRLRDAGVESVTDLAAADAADVAEASGIGESRIQKWIDRAETY